MAANSRIPYSGILLVVFGSLFLADQMGAIRFGQVFHTWWPAILVVAGLISLAERPASVFGPIILLTVGCALLLSNLGVVRFTSVWRLWPLILIAAGLNAIFGRSKGS